MKILRYLGKFSKGIPVELRVVYNQEEKIAGYFAISMEGSTTINHTPS